MDSPPDSPSERAGKPTHVCRNLRTDVTVGFCFVRTDSPYVWDLVTPDGKSIGSWNKRTRMYALHAGISNHVIMKIDEPTNTEVIRQWTSIRPGK